MVFRTTVTGDGYPQLGDAARIAGFEPGALVDVIVTRSGSLILARDTDPRAIEAAFRPLPSTTGRPAALGAK